LLTRIDKDIVLGDGHDGDPIFGQLGFGLLHALINRSGVVVLTIDHDHADELHILPEFLHVQPGSGKRVIVAPLHSDSEVLSRNFGMFTFSSGMISEKSSPLLMSR
jgi:hypothetical protein